MKLNMSGFFRQEASPSTSTSVWTFSIKGHERPMASAEMPTTWYILGRSADLGFGDGHNSSPLIHKKEESHASSHTRPGIGSVFVALDFVFASR